MTVSNINELYNENQDTEAYEILSKRLSLNKIDNKIFKKKIVLNICDNSGRYSKALLRLGAHKVDTLNEITKPKNWPLKLPYIYMSLDNIKYLGTKYDFIFCNGILSHKKNWKSILKNLSKLMNNDAYLWLSLYAEGSHWKFADKFRLQFGKKDNKNFVNALILRDWPPNKINFLKELFFTDNRIYFSKKKIENFLTKNNYDEITFLSRGIKTDLNEKIYRDKKLKKIYGDGEIRLIAKINKK